MIIRQPDFHGLLAFCHSLRFVLSHKTKEGVENRVLYVIINIITSTKLLCALCELKNQLLLGEQRFHN